LKFISPSLGRTLNSMYFWHFMGCLTWSSKLSIRCPFIRFHHIYLLELCLIFICSFCSWV